MLRYKSSIAGVKSMSDLYDWGKLSEEDKLIILKFVSDNNSLVREVMRNEFPSLYIGRAPEEVARGWLMVAGREKVMNLISSRG